MTQAAIVWFRNDLRLANNSMGWQWVAGCGTDAARHFRILNPVSQAAKFDPAGTYVRRWVPELARLPDELIHDPTAAGGYALRAANVRLGQNYPRPVVDHAVARVRALEAYQGLKG